jgi:cytochrome bd ubiquinol oxidase subunit I
VFCAVYSFIFAFGIYYIHRLLRAGPTGRLIEPPVGAVPNRPMSVVHHHHATTTTVVAGE